MMNTQERTKRHWPKHSLSWDNHVNKAYAEGSLQLPLGPHKEHFIDLQVYATHDLPLLRQMASAVEAGDDAASLAPTEASAASTSSRLSTVSTRLEKPRTLEMNVEKQYSNMGIESAAVDRIKAEDAQCQRNLRIASGEDDPSWLKRHWLYFSKVANGNCTDI